MKMIHSSKIHPEVKTLLSYATSEKKVEKEYSLYIACPERLLYGYTFEQDIVGCIGIVKREANQCEIKHIAVSPAYRGKGIGREMIRYVEEHHVFSSIYAETDQDAVIFYKNNGFHITSLGEKYPGVERFGCLLTYTT
ncbi:MULTISPECIES: GNAT family N-acetyltransferase [Lysinibacillus]|uniref:GNAT family N-acetyltransferase n=1 Tax=Lysinibacillus TaxID=400634 RepID=UPI001C8B4D71|nr:MULTISPECIES: GNAT family N-acetyltransferase [Lysinibacillus]WHP42900.1 GNAT family N-acetyltransferase [Lysinibacillus boronitolerans]MBX8945529.1 GNAT family N-acetyltransferase [Lysinibacillus sp. K60]UNT53487.1 GNAT family N-acetyltransferase [Lysinibacillus capsici]UUV26778.1 GNAT family N-acetyltransferase [Lysinibacillus sp. FN11]UYB49662.1 GNAT family N-acetyltransferase [Lysinibacillus capsici]